MEIKHLCKSASKNIYPIVYPQIAAANKLTEMKTKKRVRLTPVTRIGAITSSYFAHNGLEQVLKEHSYFSYTVTPT